jgi:hypothetical protein
VQQRQVTVIGEERRRDGEERAMIGVIRFDVRGEVADAILGDDGCWSCGAVPCLAHPLDILFSPNWEGLPAGRRHLQEAARWLKGTIVLGADRPIPATARSPHPGVRADPYDRPFHPPTILSTRQSDRLTYRAAAEMCTVSPAMIGLWVETGAWPMPRRGGIGSATFGRSEVEGWLATGDWPVGARFHAPPEDGVPPLLEGTSRRLAEGFAADHKRVERLCSAW